MPRLHLKKTQAEEGKDARRKERKSRKHKEKKDRYSDYCEEDDSRRKKRHRRSRSISPKRESTRHHPRRYYNQPPPHGNPGPSSYAQGSGYEEDDDETARARLEDELFEQKMRDALAEDGICDPTQRLDGVEARLNSYAHIPRRWRGTDEGFSAGIWMEDAREDIGLEPWQMNDDEYAEYIRAGMWRKKNQAEYEERLRNKEERKRRQEREAKLREEIRRLEREAQAERDKRVAAKARRRLEEAKQVYEERWSSLLTRAADDDVSRTPLSFEDIPWPIAPPKKGTLSRDADNITKEGVSSFLLRPADSGGVSKSVSASASLPSARDILRATMLRFHPDKFEARVLARVSERDKEFVKDSANLVVRILNDLLKDIRE